MEPFQWLLVSYFSAYTLAFLALVPLRHRWEKRPVVRWLPWVALPLSYIFPSGLFHWGYYVGVDLSAVSLVLGVPFFLLFWVSLRIPSLPVRYGKVKAFVDVFLIIAATVLQSWAALFLGVMISVLFYIPSYIIDVIKDQPRQMARRSTSIEITPLRSPPFPLPPVYRMVSGYEFSIPPGFFNKYKDEKKQVVVLPYVNIPENEIEEIILYGEPYENYGVYESYSPARVKREQDGYHVRVRRHFDIDKVEVADFTKISILIISSPKSGFLQRLDKTGGYIKSGVAVCPAAKLVFFGMCVDHPFQ